MLVTAGAIALRHKRPYFIVGWFWYLVMLIPVIGVVQVGSQARADRYTYLPQIGLYLLLTWATTDALASWPHRRRILGAIAAIVITALTWRAWIQASYWRNSESLWVHTLAATSENPIAHNNLAVVLTEKGRTDEAIAEYRKAVQDKPDYAQAYYALGNVLLGKGRIDEAIAQYQYALKIRPDYPEVQNNMGVALMQKGRLSEAIAHWQKTLEIQSDFVDALNNLAWVLATFPEPSIRNGAKAMTLAERAHQLSGDSNPAIFRTLAAAYAENGRFVEAIDIAQRGLQLAKTRGNSDLADIFEGDIALYRTNASVRTAPQPGNPPSP